MVFVFFFFNNKKRKKQIHMQHYQLDLMNTPEHS